MSIKVTFENTDATQTIESGEEVAVSANGELVVTNAQGVALAAFARGTWSHAEVDEAAVPGNLVLQFDAAHFSEETLAHFAADVEFIRAGRKL